jgi:hypothetical protein
MAENKLSGAGGVGLKCCSYSFSIFIPLLTALIRGTMLWNSVSAGHLTKNGLTPFIVFILFYFYPFTHPTY